jgi:hypothetical protein
LLDYGPEWKAAWAEHVKVWDAKVQSGEIPKEWPLRAADLNKEYGTKHFKTPEEQENEPYPENVSLGAFLMVADSTETGRANDPKIWTSPPKDGRFLAEHIFEADVISFEEVDDAASPYNYTIRWANTDGAETYVSKVPHSAFVFVDEAETGDLFTDEPFRHYISIPDDVFPQGPWRNAEE